METYSRWLQTKINDSDQFVMCPDPSRLQEEDIILYHGRKGIIHERREQVTVVYWLDTHEWTEENLEVKGIRVKSQSLQRQDILRQWGNQLFHFVDSYKKGPVHLSVNQEKFNQLFSYLYYSIHK